MLRNMKLTKYALAIFPVLTMIFSATIFYFGNSDQKIIGSVLTLITAFSAMMFVWCENLENQIMALNDSIKNLEKSKKR